VIDADQTQDTADEQFEYRWFSGTGAGGQHRNKHQNCLELTHVATGIKQSAHGRCRESNKREALDAIRAKLQSHYAGQFGVKKNTDRSSQIGSGMRGDKRRTYRFQDDSVVDHETNKATSCRSLMKGKFDELWS
jgi:peptide chain release factor 1